VPYEISSFRDLVAVVAIAPVDRFFSSSDHVKPRPLCAIFSPSFQSPRNLPSLGHLTDFRAASLDGFGGFLVEFLARDFGLPARQSCLILLEPIELGDTALDEGFFDDPPIVMRS
jgi:hypothetical protein